MRSKDLEKQRRTAAVGFKAIAQMVEESEDDDEYGMALHMMLLAVQDAQRKRNSKNLGEAFVKLETGGRHA